MNGTPHLAEEPQPDWLTPLKGVAYPHGHAARITGYPRGATRSMISCRLWTPSLA